MKRSFSSGVREELCGLEINSRHCALAELAAFLNGVCKIKQDGIVIQTEQPHLRLRFDRLLKFAFYENAPARKVMSAAGVTGQTVDPVVIMAECCKRAYIRGCLITGGTINDPSKHYHMEFTFPGKGGEALAKQLRGILNSFDINAKTRTGHPLVYVKDAADIVETLLLTGAGKSLLQFESTRVTKEIANDINRKVNCETANLTKTVNAAVSQLNDIKFIAEHKGLGCLSEPLEEAARLRLEFETASLQEIGAMLNPPIGKSGVNHRLRKISEIAEALRSTTVN